MMIYSSARLEQANFVDISASSGSVTEISMVAVVIAKASMINAIRASP
jgi:hypothetical protein